MSKTRGKAKRDPLPRLWVLVDKRGTILSRGDLQRFQYLDDGACKYDIPACTIWSSKANAVEIRRQIRSNMAADAWKTWKFRIVEYTRKDR